MSESIELEKAIFQVVVYKTDSAAIERETIEYVCETVFVYNGTLTLGDLGEDHNDQPHVWQPLATYAPGSWISCVRVDA